MGWFTDWLMGGPSPPPSRSVQAAAGTVALAPRSWAGRATLPWDFGAPLEPFVFPDGMPPWWDRPAVMTIPAASRCRDLICSTVGQLPLTWWTVDVSSVPAVERRIPGRSWADRPDPDRTRQWMLAWTTDDLFFYGRAHWLVTARYADSYPMAFRRIPPGDLTEDSPGRWTYTDPSTGQRTRVDPRDIVEFLSPDDGLLDKGYRALSISLQLDSAADRFAGAEVPAGVLEEQDLGQEDMSGEELAALASNFATARLTNTTAATNRYVRYREIPYDASKMQLVEARTYQALEIARICDVPPYLVGAPAGTGMTYLNTQQASTDLINFGVQTYVSCIEQTLSGPNVTPRGQLVRLDLNVFLRNPFTSNAEASPNDAQIADPTQPPAETPTEVAQ